jgi:hypothetical protein
MSLVVSQIQVPSPSIYPLGIRLDEPVTTLTDLLISAVCAFAFLRMSKLPAKPWSQIHLKNYFLLVGLATLLGGLLGHGFFYALSHGWKLPGWIVGIISVALIERSSISHAHPLLPPRVGNFFMTLNVIEMVAILIITILTIDFKWVEYHNAYGLIVNVAGFHAYTYFKTKDRGSFLILAGVGITALASLVFTQHYSLHTWFNYIDISHVLLAIAAYVIYRGGLKMDTTGRKFRPQPVASRTQIDKPDS